MIPTGCNLFSKEAALKTKQQIIDILASCKPEVERNFGVKRLALFGSYARGEQKPDSDVDILVEVGPEIGLEFVTLADRIEQLLGEPVELVSTRAIKPKFLQHISKDLEYV